jgi:hypothetical protein
LSKIIRKISLPEHFIWVAAALLIVFTGYGCNTKIEGCLEANAENFDLNAERPCSGCCTYPSMNLSLSQKWNDRNFTNADTLYDVHSQPYKIIDLKYFLSSWVWLDSEGGHYTVDSVEAGCNESTISFTTDNLIMDTKQFVYTLGSIRKSPAVDSLHFTLGLYQDFSCLDENDTDTPSSLTDQSPLWNPSTATLETIRLIVQRDLENEVNDTLYIHTLQDVRLGYTLQMKPGIDVQLNLSVNYAQWFQDADRSDLSSFSSSITTNFANSIVRTP